MSFGSRLKSLRNELGLTQEQLAEKINLSKANVSKYEADLIEPNLETLNMLSSLFNVSADYILGRTDSPNINDSYFTLDNVMPIETYQLPLLGTIACGEPILAEENIEEYITADLSVKADFALRCKGDSMINARIFDGDIVYVRQQPDVENGEIAAVLIDTEATLKRVYKYPNRIELRPENPTFPVFNYEGDDIKKIKIMGKAIAFLSNVR